MLEKIKAEKARLIKEKKIKKSKPLPPIKSAEIPFKIPSTWQWVRFQEVGLFERGKSKHRPRNAPQLFKNGKYPFVQTGDVSQAKITNYQIQKYSKSYNDLGLAQSRMWKKGTLCITIAANIAETGFLTFDACFPDSVVGFTSLVSGSLSSFVKFFIDITKKDLEKFAPSTAQKNINLGIIESLKCPLPPEHEIEMIIFRVNQLFNLCDELEASLTSNYETGSKYINSILSRIFTEKSQEKAQETVKTISVSLHKTNFTPEDKRNLAAARIADKLYLQPTFGHVKFQKLLYLTEYLLQEDFKSNYYRFAAGPHDPKTLEAADEAFEENNWFKVCHADNRYSYKADANLKQYRQIYTEVFNDKQKSIIDNLTAKLKTFTSDNCEVIATLYAVWNDIIIDGRYTCDNDIIYEYRHEWNKSKKRHSVAELTQWLSWMRDHNIVPTGWGKKTKIRKR